MCVGEGVKHDTRDCSSLSISIISVYIILRAPCMRRGRMRLFVFAADKAVLFIRLESDICKSNDFYAIK